MPNQENMEGTQGRNAQVDTRVSPTLFIALGGTGMEIALRVRRRILNHVWNEQVEPLRIGSLTEFPLAEFLHFDLDAGSIVETGKDNKTDPLANLVKFDETEKIVGVPNVNAYAGSEERLKGFPHISPWFPLTPKDVVDLDFTNPDGAGMVRAVSRLHFFDRYTDLKNMIRSKINHLRSSVDADKILSRLGLETNKEIKVVVLASTAGGTGSGSFIDMGYLAGYLARQESEGARTSLCLMLPSGYTGKAPERVDANTYAALMELETIYGKKVSFKYFVDKWTDKADEVAEKLNGETSVRPYNSIFLFDLTNVSGESTQRTENMFDMVADILFEDFASEQFAQRKRSNAPNIRVEHILPSFDFEVNSNIVGNVTMQYSKAYSSFGQSIIDTQLDQRRDQEACKRVNKFLNTFFGIASAISGDTPNKKTPQSVDATNIIEAAPVNCRETSSYEVKYTFAKREDRKKYGTAQREYLKIIDDILDTLVASYNREVLSKIDNIYNTSNNLADIIRRIDDYICEIERGLDMKPNPSDPNAGNYKKLIVNAREGYYQKIVADDSQLINSLWETVKNRETGGIDYTIALIELIRDQLTKIYIEKLNDSTEWFGKLRNSLIDELNEQRKRLVDLGSKDNRHTNDIVSRVKEVMTRLGGVRLRELACIEAARLLEKLSNHLGEHEGMDEAGEKQWTKGSFAGVLVEYKQLIKVIMCELEDEQTRANKATKKTHAGYQHIAQSRQGLDDEIYLSEEEISEMGEKAFENIGGPREIFKALKDEVKKRKMIWKLRSLALAKLPRLETGERNPLYLELKTRKNNNSHNEIIKRCVEMAMPWVPISCNGNQGVRADAYSGIIGVEDSQLWEREFGYEFRSKVPTQRSSMPEERLGFEGGVPGKLICYVQLDGFPLLALKDLTKWKTNYELKKNNTPLHLHWDTTRFVHPIKMEPETLNTLVEGFWLYLQGIILRVLTRNLSWKMPRYNLKIGTDSGYSIGTEQHVRKDGIPVHSDSIRQQVNSSLERTNTAAQGTCLYLLYLYYDQKVYPVRRDIQQGGSATDYKGFSHLVCEKLAEQQKLTLERRFGANEIKRLMLKIAGAEAITEIDFDSMIMDSWTDIIQSSKDEVVKGEIGEEHKEKRVLKSEFFTEGWIEDLFDLNEHGKIPPEPLGFRPYKVAIDNVSCGPFDWKELFEWTLKGKLSSTTKVWRKPMTAWQLAGEIEELLPLLPSEEPSLIDDDEPLLN